MNLTGAILFYFVAADAIKSTEEIVEEQCLMSTRRRLTVETKCGELEGVLARNLYTFKGVPYAAPPVGELRWLPPQPCKSWQGVRPANNYGTIAPQNVMALPGFAGKPEPQS
jgi:hypothetical protein